jgi:hypothetical protein
VSGTVETWTPETVLKAGESSPGEYLKVIQWHGDSVEVQIEPGGKRKKLKPQDTVSASTTFIGLNSEKNSDDSVQFYVEVGKRFRVPEGESEYIILEADSRSIRVAQAGQDVAAAIAIPRRTQGEAQRKDQ